MGGQKFKWEDRSLYGGTEIYKGDRSGPAPNIHHMHSYVSIYVTQLNTEYTYTDIICILCNIQCILYGHLSPKISH